MTDTRLAHIDQASFLGLRALVHQPFFQGTWVSERAIDLAPAALQGTFAPTSATCPMGDLLVDDATLAVQQVLPAGWIVEVDLDFEQQWSPQRLSPELREQFGWHDDQR